MVYTNPTATPERTMAQHGETSSSAPCPGAMETSSTLVERAQQAKQRAVDTYRLPGSLIAINTDHIQATPHPRATPKAPPARPECIRLGPGYERSPHHRTYRARPIRMPLTLRTNTRCSTTRNKRHDLRCDHRALPL